jgi:DNA (cytosine-5)-methyltransferase 1
MNTMHLFAGAGGGLLADLILGHTPVIAVEWDKYACQVLRKRTADGWFPGLQVWEGDVRLFDPSEYAGRMDCISAGFPCTDLSSAGNQAGLSEGTRSGLYREVLRIADIVRPRFLFLENVAAILANEWLGTVLGDLAARGYDARWTCLPASAAGAPHYRDRWWCLAERADADSSGELQPQGCECEHRGRVGDLGEDVADTASERTRENHSRLWEGISGTGGGEGTKAKNVADTHGEVCSRLPSGTEKEKPFIGILRQNVAHPMLQRSEGEQPSIADQSQRQGPEQRQDRPCSDGDGRGSTESDLGGMVDGLASELDADWWSTEPDVGRTATGVPNRSARIKALGNGQVPIQAATAWVILGGPITQ